MGKGNGIEYAKLARCRAGMESGSNRTNALCVEKMGFESYILWLEWPTVEIHPCKWGQS